MPAGTLLVELKDWVGRHTRAVRGLAVGLAVSTGVLGVLDGLVGVEFLDKLASPRWAVLLIIAMSFIGSGAFVFLTSLTKITICEFDRTLSYLPIYMADRLGYFASEGLIVDYIQSHSDTKTWDTLVTGKAAFGVSDPLVMVENPIARGLVVASIIIKSGLCGISKEEMPRVTAPGDLAGRKLATYDERSTSYRILLDFMESTGLRLGTDFEITQISPHTEFHYIDLGFIVFTHQPASSLARISGCYEVFAAGDFPRYAEFLNTGAFVTDAYLRANRHTVAAFVRAVARALDTFHKEPGRAIDVALREFPDHPRKGVLAGVVRLFVQDIIATDPTVQEHRWHNCLATRFKGTAQAYPFSEYVDNSFARAAVDGSRR